MLTLFCMTCKHIKFKPRDGESCLGHCQASDQDNFSKWGISTPEKKTSKQQRDIYIKPLCPLVFRESLTSNIVTNDSLIQSLPWKGT